MRSFMSLVVAALVFGSALIPHTASAALISGPGQISASTSVPVCEAICAGIGADINEIADDDTSNLNGFAGQTGVTGIITLDLLGVLDLDSFTLFNDVNVLAEGVEMFLLRFFNAADEVISTTGTLTAPVGQFEGETYVFPGTVLGVSKVEFEVLTLLNGSRIEVREVQFNGEEASTVPLPAGLALLGSGLVALGFVRKVSRSA
jgi:hypothetical protein